eukprot:TRINITY_DN13266_c0_g1_i3.p3 TRINITY_DN13266_c0_g1~~TRINITY_DN13266_c0_g1_i3.p3  ORF type:complete len:122 (+),score=18.78 TRINITY_DN13266_c0_g1_i3:151-516(+)
MQLTKTLMPMVTAGLLRFGTLRGARRAFVESVIGADDPDGPARGRGSGCEGGAWGGMMLTGTGGAVGTARCCDDGGRGIAAPPSAGIMGKRMDPNMLGDIPRPGIGGGGIGEGNHGAGVVL